MENKYKVSDFASLIGCSQKTIYKMIERGELITVNEPVNGRKTTFISSNNKQIQELQKIYGNLPVNEGECKETLQNDESNLLTINGENIDLSANFIDKMIKLNDQYNERLMKVTEELITYKSRVPLLEDKASREGLYLSEINQLKTDNGTLTKTKNKVIVMLISVILLLTGVADNINTFVLCPDLIMSFINF